MAKDNHQSIHQGDIVDHRNGFDVIACEHCGFNHVMPLPTLEDLDKVYRHEYYSTEKPLFLEQSEEDSAWWQQVYDDRFDTFESSLSEDKRTILDVGSGPGRFLKTGLDRGWTVKGIEPSVQACEYARSIGVNVLQDFFNPESAKTLGKYDVIHASQVLEHVPNPIQMIEIMSSLLNADGVICIVVPNDFSPFQLALQDVENYEPWWIAPPHHLNYFNFKSLTSLLERQGFEVFLKDTTFPIDMFLLMGENYIGNDQLGRQCHKKRIRFETQLAKAGQNQLRRSWYQGMAEQGIGREVCLFAKKVK
ncbi:class I SAM-dependent methyltransferase [Thalassotalea atypica]|uniref:class I SAM-dependent methyltransferase n=1 Tax=Thalassotalea atypica TaxID=2054316 RepID=UPI002573168D|nr:class I SAM-dependent methyltransferase [Thalassotalea atypica]